MISVITRNKLFYKRQEIWFYNGEPVQASDNDLFYKAYSPPAFPVRHLKENDTLFIDLKEPEEILFSKIQTKMRSKIRRAEKEKLIFEVWNPPSQIQVQDYLSSYNRFAALKKLEGELGSERIFAYLEKKILIVTCMKNKDQPVTYHSYLADGNSIVVSLYIHHNINFNDDTLRGFANKLHFWKDILYFKSLGIGIYDFGGVDLVHTPEGIGQFKMAFGGEMTKQYNFQRVKGLYSLLKR